MVLPFCYTGAALVVFAFFITWSALLFQVTRSVGRLPC